MKPSQRAPCEIIILFKRSSRNRKGDARSILHSRRSLSSKATVTRDDVAFGKRPVLKVLLILDLFRYYFRKYYFR